MSDIQIFPDGRMDTRNAAKYLGYSAGTMNVWRVHGKGPAFTKLDGKIFYFQKDLDRWIAAPGISRTTAQARLNLSRRSSD